MPMNMPHPRRKGQTAIEYMVLLGIVVALVLIAFKTQLPRTEESANVYFNRATLGIIGKPNPCGDGFCCQPFEDLGRCPPDCAGGAPGCPGTACTNPFDPGSGTYSVCSGSDTGLMVSVDWTLVSYGGCSATKCQYQCNSGFMPSGSTCVPAVCSGAASFTGATFCVGSDTGLTTVTNWSLSLDCTGAKCEYECLPGYYQLTSVDCVLAACLGNPLFLAIASLCPGDGVGLTADVQRTLKPSCSFPDGSDPKCEYTCPSGYLIYSNDCCPDQCPFGSCGTQTVCGAPKNCGNCCGNGAIDGSEPCDGTILLGESCTTRGYTGTGGPLLCNSTCTGFDESNCCNAVNGTWGAPWTDVGVCGTYTACFQRQQGTCNATCGGTCPGSGTQDVACGTVVGGWSTSILSACSVSCGGGIQTESRVCNNPSPACGGECQRWDGSYTTSGNRTDSRTISCNPQACAWAPSGCSTVSTCGNICCALLATMFNNCPVANPTGLTCSSAGSTCRTYGSASGTSCPFCDYTCQ